MTHSTDTYTLVADIGGTNTRVALAKGNLVQHSTITRFQNAQYASLEPVLKLFMNDHKDVSCERVCVAVAGPVRHGHGRLTNLDWEIDTATLERCTGAKITRVFNDLQAQGHALGELPQSAFSTIRPVDDLSATATKMVIGIGTGFNAALVLNTSTGDIVPPAEAGHMNLQARSADELSFVRHLENSLGFASVEDMLSGRGLERLYSWVSSSKGEKLDKSAAQIMSGLSDGTDPNSNHAATMFVRMLGAVTGNLALIHLPFGGIYFSGGVARAFAPYFQNMGLIDGFCDKGRFATFMEGFPIYIIEDDNAALAGCANYISHQVS